VNKSLFSFKERHYFKLHNKRRARSCLEYKIEEANKNIAPIVILDCHFCNQRNLFSQEELISHTLLKKGKDLLPYVVISV
jgi:hypothetical protein